MASQCVGGEALAQVRVLVEAHDGDAVAAQIHAAYEGLGSGFGCIQWGTEH